MYRFCAEITFRVAEVYIVGEGSDIFRLNLEDGLFMAPVRAHSVFLHIARAWPATRVVKGASVCVQLVCAVVACVHSLLRAHLR